MWSKWRFHPRRGLVGAVEAGTIEISKKPQNYLRVKNMDKLPEKTELFRQGYNCCQIISVYLADACCFDADEAKEKLGVMCETCGGTCSTLRGGTYAFSAYAKGKGYDHEKTRAMVDKLYERFRAKHGGILCKEIAKNDIMVCATFVDTVVEIVKEMTA